MKQSKVNANYAQAVLVIDHLSDYKVHRVTVTTASQSLADLIGSALQDGVGEVEIVNYGGGTVYYQSTGNAAASTDLAILNNGSYTAKGPKDELDRIEMIAGSSIVVHLIERTAY